MPRTTYRPSGDQATAYVLPPEDEPRHPATEPVAPRVKHLGFRQRAGRGRGRGSVVDPKVVDVLVRPQAPSPLLAQPREREVLALAAQANRNAAIAARLVLSERAAEKRRRSDR